MSFLMQHLPMFLIAIPLLMAPLTILSKNYPGFQKALDIVVSIGLLALSGLLIYTVWNDGIIVYEVGEFGKYGIVLVADLLSSSMVVLSCLIGCMGLIYSYDYIESKSLNLTYHSLYNLMLAGINGIFLTGDIFNLFVFFEIMLLSSGALIVANETSKVTKISDKMEATMKYIVLNMLGSNAMLLAVTSLYASVGSLNMADIALKVRILADAGTMPWHMYAIGLLFIIVFAGKAAVFPLHYWLPDVHPTAPSPISAMLSGVIIKIGAYGILRVLFVIFAPLKGVYGPIILLLALVTIGLGATAAIGQNDVKRLLAYSSVSQIGYVFLGFGMGAIALEAGEIAGGTLIVAASFVYLVNHAIAKSMLFLTSGGIIHHAETRDMRKMGGMINSNPLMAFSFLVGAMSIGGVPPMGGFIGKFSLFDAGLRSAFYLPIAIALLFAFFTLFYMFRGWMLIFWGERDPQYGDYSHHKLSMLIVGPIMLLAALVFILGIFGNPILEIAQTIAMQITDPQPYIDAVLLRVIR
ncbi:proton-conducting transporter membrane subunit [Methanosarcina sp. 2.H.A.1B.4]|uniref:proton-conducting transporter transmembrane domain-containing protein n=1 Tax=Methanosarcina sp. 2.H.A.1B.4 TaxID=1483600 RepID=UPI0006229E8A|nr:proton-conducting transporter membrane subunit [Methanosarcina sp. 2.H.A.1B.4]KKG08628.1 cation:proton antiporter [Methanosarcina sp. 2.H.A.1B.4]